jgi:hypothetical protein
MCRREGGEVGGPKGDPQPEYVALVFVFVCGMYKLILSDNAQVTLQMKVSLSNLV